MEGIKFGDYNSFDLTHPDRILVFESGRDETPDFEGCLTWIFGHCKTDEKRHTPAFSNLKDMENIPNCPNVIANTPTTMEPSSCVRSVITNGRKRLDQQTHKNLMVW